MIIFQMLQYSQLAPRIIVLGVITQRLLLLAPQVITLGYYIITRFPGYYIRGSRHRQWRDMNGCFEQVV